MRAMGVLLASLHRLIRRLPPIAVVAVALASMLAMQWHEGSVVHVRCDAHGEMVHLGEGDSAVVSGEGPAGAARLGGSTGGQAASDDHCQFLGAACSAIVKISTPVAIDDGATLLVMLAPPTGAVIVRATFRLAPKTSPPA
jgi:hypothetical protein